jgi:NitT/TauT family transport system ATP-binding protein
MIQYLDIGKRFFMGGHRAVDALDGFSLSIAQGEFVGIVGPSGCGKSTLLNLAAGLMRPSVGQVRYGGQSVQTINTRVGYITQKDSLLPWRTVEDNVGLALQIQGMRGKARRELTQRYINMVGLDGFERHFPAELSGGMRKRVALARTLVYDPETLLMDEPFGALDAQLKLILHDELLRLWEKSGKTIVFVTHDLAEAVALSDRVVVLTPRPGRVKLVQSIELPRPRDVFHVRFTPEFGALFERLWQTLEEDIRKGEDT